MFALLALLAPVVGGSPVTPNEFPDVVLVAGWTGTCSGVLVAPDVVLTAGHCSEIDPQAVLVGSIDYGVAAGQLASIANVIAYPDWQHAFDVAVIVLAEPIANVAPRAICDGCVIGDGGALRVVGFGLEDPGGSGASTALETALVPIDDAACTSDPACRRTIAPDGELVAGGSGATACFGDSGGPLLAPAAASDAPDVLVGVVSRSTGEAATPCESPTVYVRADAVADWIEATTGRTITRAPCATTRFDAAAPADGCAATRNGSPAVAVLAFATRRRRSARRRA